MTPLFLQIIVQLILVAGKLVEVVSMLVEHKPQGMPLGKEQML